MINQEELIHWIGWKIRSYRIIHGLTIKDVAKKTGLPFSYLQDLEAGNLKRPKKEQLEKIFAFLAMKG